MNSIKEIWGKTKEELSQDRINLMYTKLQASGDKEIVTLREQLMNAQEGYQEALVASKDNGDYGAIRKLALEVKIAKKELEEATALYKEHFGVEPRA